MTHISIHSDTTIGAVSLLVSDLEKLERFYCDVIGFRVLGREEDTVTLTVDGNRPLLKLRRAINGVTRPLRTTGLYHFAILVPTRRDLARSLKHLIETGWPLTGAADHLVSEALYLNDPEGNGIEIYRDRLKETWEYCNGMIKMASDPPDIPGILGELADNPEPWTGLPAGTKMGHVHLQVANLDAARTFYHDILGFDIAAAMPSALFISAGGYHHHIGLNTWTSEGAPSPPAEAAGLDHFKVELPSESELERVVERLRDAGIPLEQTDLGIVVRDPSENRVLLAAR